MEGKGWHQKGSTDDKKKGRDKLRDESFVEAERNERKAWLMILTRFC